MPVITISTESWAGGYRVGRQLAEAIGGTYWDKGVAHQVALAARVSDEEVAGFEEQNHSAFHAFFANLFDLDALKRQTKPSAEEVTQTEYDDREVLPFQFEVDGWIDSEVYRHLIAKTITALADRGNVVLVGRGSQFILAEHADVVHLRFVARREDRIAWAARDHQCSPEEAARRVDDSDARSRHFMEHYFDADPNLAQHYGMVLNTSRVKRARCFDLIHQTLASLPTP